MNTIVIKQKDKDLYAAIDLAIERAKKVLRRHHDKITHHKVKEEVIVEEDTSDDTEEIVPMRLNSYKPIEVEEALTELKDSGMQFFVFIDMEDKMRVLYKKTEKTFGLY